MPLLMEHAGPCPVLPGHPANANRPDFGDFAPLTPREVMLLFLVSDVCLGVLESPFDAHAETAIGFAGISVDDIRELLRHLVPYAGFNATSMAFERLLDLPMTAGAEAPSPAISGTTLPAYSDWILEGFGSLDPVLADQLRRSTDTLWSRAGLSARERAMVTLTVDIVGGTLGCSFGVHLAVAKRHGIDSDDLSAILLLLGQRLPERAERASRALTIPT